ncbi:MocR-like pyridoxine biosynthesis transcription factor PdxR [Jatrophihabitans sp. DSM 45814]
MTGADFLQLDAESAPPGQLARWLADELRAAIADGRLAVGARLPSTRDLASDLRVSRGVVTEAYQRLVDDGRVVGRRGAGTVVVSTPTTPASPQRTVGPLPGPSKGREIAERLHPVGPTVEIDLSPGVPDLAAFPRMAWLKAERSVLDHATNRHFGYPSPQGAVELREALARWLGRVRGIAVPAESIIIVAGVAQALALVTSTLAAGGVRSVAVEDPGSLGARHELQFWGMRTPPVRVDEEGLVVSDLLAADAQAVLATPAHEFPTGVVLSPNRRRELLAWSVAGGLIIEDDYDSEHRYDRPPVQALAGLAPEQVIYLGSISKILAPAMRIGWIVAPPRYFENIVEWKRNTDLGNPVLPQLALAAMMRSGALEAHLRAVRRRHRQRRDAMASALAEHLPQARVHGIAAGLHLMVTFAEGIDDAAIAEAALARGVRVQPLSWHRQLPGPPGLVLGYAASAPDAIRTGIKRLARLLGRW